MPRLQIILCSVEYGKLNEVSILELNVNPSDDFKDVKVKIQDHLQDHQQYKLEFDHLFFFCKGKLLNDNDEMKQYQLKNLPDIKIYKSQDFQQLLDTYNQFQQILQQSSQQQSQSQQQQQQYQKYIDLEQSACKAQIENEQMIKSQQEEIVKLQYQIDRHKAKIQQAEKKSEAQLQQYKNINQELYQQKRAFEALQKQFDDQSVDLEMAVNEKIFLEEKISKLIQNYQNQ